MQTNFITKNKNPRIKSLGDNILSHNTMAAFFSGQDQTTLREEGNDRNCFVSLIVNNAGTYCAAITRKIQTKNEVTVKRLGSSYEFFGEGPITTGEDPMSETTQVIDKEVIQYFMLDIEKEEVENPLSWLDTRFDEIQQKKKDESNSKLFLNNINHNTRENPAWLGSKIDKDEDFFDWIHSNKKTDTKKNESKELSLWEKQEMDASMYVPDPVKIHDMVTKMVLCSFIVDTKKTDLKQWITRHMEKKYKELFTQDMSFDAWCEFVIYYLFDEYSDVEAPVDYYLDTDELHAVLAEAMIDELNKYPSNGYIELYINMLNRFLE